jgi:hypothetical protein
MKHLLPICATVLFTAALLSSHTRGEPQALQLGGAIGKYQLATGHYPVILKDQRGQTMADQAGVFKLDTETGQVWMLVQRGDTTKNEITTRWITVENSQ